MAIWAAKIAAKLILGRIPFRHQLLRKLSMFKHGRMDEAAHALSIFNLHKKAAYPGGPPAGISVLELGPGDSLATALIAKAYGAGSVYLCDVDHYATDDIEKYQGMAIELKQSGLDNVPNLANADYLEEMLEACNAQYLTNGLEGLRSIPDKSIDFIWSHSVLEHIRKRDFYDTMLELRRILKDTGRVSHNVDLMDHLQKSLNSLRFSESIWENETFANSGFYTNRLRCEESLKLMEKSGFRIVTHEKGQWDELPLPREKMHSDFNSYSDDELRVRTYSILLTAA